MSAHTPAPGGRVHPSASSSARNRAPDRRNPFISSTFRHQETRSFFAARWRNLAVGSLLMGFVGGVFAYSMNSVSRDDFAGYDKDGIKIVTSEEKRVV